MKIGDRVRIELTGHGLHKRCGAIVYVVEDDFLGKIYTVSVDGFPQIGFSAACLRPVMAKDAAA